MNHVTLASDDRDRPLAALARNRLADALGARDSTPRVTARSPSEQALSSNRSLALTIITQIAERRFVPFSPTFLP
ncbi:hypothetical protein LC1Hm_2125 [Halomicrobium sp. LC1Hm]|nr:hypothetical protein LC1Hm_2125 [Halomicrobium sp. LC1Hm]